MTGQLVASSFTNSYYTPSRFDAILDWQADDYHIKTPRRWLPKRNLREVRTFREEARRPENLTLLADPQEPL